MIFKEAKSGKTVESAEIHAYVTEDPAKKYLYLFSGVHGDEVEGVYVLKQLFEWLKQDDLLDYPTVVIPVLNIDGYCRGSRTNSHGVDLNRNLPTQDWSPEAKSKKYFPGAQPLSEPENEYLVQLFHTYPPGLIISFHSWKPILNFNGDCQKVAELIHQYNDYEVNSDIGYPTPGSLGTYAPQEFEAPVLTYELPRLDSGKSLNEIWEENKEGLITFLKSSDLHSYLD